MKKYVFAMLLMVVMQIGCSAEDTGLYEVSHTGVESQLEEVSFEYQLPTMLPFEVSSVEFSRPSMSQPVFVLDYQGAEGEYLSLQVADADLSMTNEDVEEVSVGEQTGMYTKNGQGAQILQWELEDMYYGLSTNQDEIGKADLIEIAESFE